MFIVIIIVKSICVAEGSVADVITQRDPKLLHNICLQSEWHTPLSIKKFIKKRNKEKNNHHMLSYHNQEQFLYKK